MNRSKYFNKEYVLNCASFFMYKSNRKNAKISDVISVNHLITNKDNGKINDDRILQQFINTIEKVVYYTLDFNKHIEISCNLDYYKQEQYKNANNEIYAGFENNYMHFDRKTFYSIEQCINYIYSIYCFIYPYNTLSLSNTIYNNPSIKHLINKYYNN
jgi:hypothetical protein